MSAGDLERSVRQHERDEMRGLSDADAATYAAWLRRQVAMADEDGLAPWLGDWLAMRAEAADAEISWRRRAESRGGPALERGNWRQRIENLREGLDIVLELQCAGAPLKRAGAEWVGLCPFHSERTPSFHVNPAKRVWKCHGCGVGGDVFSFFELKLGLDFPDVVRLLESGTSAPAYLAATDHQEIVARHEQIAQRYGRG